MSYAVSYADTFTIKKGDRLPKLRHYLVRADGSYVDLTGFSGVQFRLGPAAGGAAKFTSSGSIITAAQGLVEYAWGATDTDTEGDFLGEWVCTSASGVQTVPSSGYVRVTVEPTLG
jgi:hypothetical protein